MTPSAAPTADYEVANKKYVDDSAGGGGALADLSDVTITSVADNEVLAYDTATSKWINQTPAEAGLLGLAGGTLTGNLLMGALGIGNNNPIITFATGVAGEALFAGDVHLASGHAYKINNLTTLSSVVLSLVETTTPSEILGMGRIYTKTDNLLYFTDGAGTEHEAAGGMAYFFAYRTTAFTMTNANTWYDYPWNIAATVKTGFTHTHDGGNPEQITVTAAGKYEITVDTTYYSVASTLFIRLLLDGTEIAGSYRQNTVPQLYTAQMSCTVIATVTAGQVLEVQVGASTAGTSVQFLDTTPAPTVDVAAAISITRLGP